MTTGALGGTGPLLLMTFLAELMRLVLSQNNFGRGSGRVTTAANIVGGVLLVIEAYIAIGGFIGHRRGGGRGSDCRFWSRRRRHSNRRRGLWCGRRCHRARLCWYRFHSWWRCRRGGFDCGCGGKSRLRNDRWRLYLSGRFLLSGDDWLRFRCWRGGCFLLLTACDQNHGG